MLFCFDLGWTGFVGEENGGREEGAGGSPGPGTVTTAPPPPSDASFIFWQFKEPDFTFINSVQILLFSFAGQIRP